MSSIGAAVAERMERARVRRESLVMGDIVWIENWWLLVEGI